MSAQYDDIIDLPHFQAAGHPRMSPSDRATQFAPYKSLVGYEEMIKKKTEELEK